MDDVYAHINLHMCLCESINLFVILEMRVNAVHVIEEYVGQRASTETPRGRTVCLKGY